ncbi:MAG: DHHA1 domain-containing protein [Terriglobales bacterium]
MTERLYYNQPALLEFDSVVQEVIAPTGDDPRHAFTLRESAFYPTSGGQVHDTGWVTLGGNRLKVGEIVEAEDGRIVHYLEGPTEPPLAGTPVHGAIDRDRRRDHMQQHSGQHVLSAAFIELYEMPTVSFHMGDDYCSIDLSTTVITPGQVAGAEKRANEIVFENRPVTIRYVHRDEAEKLGLRKMPPAERDELRLIEVANFDLSACGGTHVNATGQIGSILLRKTEKTRQGTRVEFVCGGRAVAAARQDYSTLTEAASLFSAKPADVPVMIRKTFDEARDLRRQKDDALEQLAGAIAEAALAGASDNSTTATPSGARVIKRIFANRDAGFAKLFVQKASRAGSGIVALAASTMNPPGVVFAQTPGGSADMGALLKQALAAVGGRGGGSRDFAQGGVPEGCDVEKLLREAADKIV